LVRFICFIRVFTHNWFDSVNQWMEYHYWCYFKIDVASEDTSIYMNHVIFNFLICRALLQIVIANQSLLSSITIRHLLHRLNVTVIASWIKSPAWGGIILWVQHLLTTPEESASIECLITHRHTNFLLHRAALSIHVWYRLFSFTYQCP